MNTAPASASLLRLSAGLSRVGIRHGSHLARYKKPQPEKAGFWPGHGEKIWVFNHIDTNQIVYSTKPVLDSNKALKQLPFNGKKTKPAKLRKDYWKTMAIIKFPEGEGNIGRSVYQKLREFRRLHELSWGYQADSFYKMSKKDRGKALNDQKANAIADIAAVLGGAGRGNLMWRKPDAEVEAPAAAAPPAAAAEEDKSDASAPVEQPAKATEEVTKEEAKEEAKEEVAATQQRTPPFPGAVLAPASIYWAHEWDSSFVDKWSPNVKHGLGLNPNAEIRDEKPEASPESSTEEGAEQNQEQPSQESTSQAQPGQEQPRAP